LAVVSYDWKLVIVQPAKCQYND